MKTLVWCDTGFNIFSIATSFSFNLSENPASNCALLEQVLTDVVWHFIKNEFHQIKFRQRCRSRRWSSSAEAVLSHAITSLSGIFRNLTFLADCLLLVLELTACFNSTMTSIKRSRVISQVMTHLMLLVNLKCLPLANYIDIIIMSV